jgi:hypothetical protein
MYPFFLTDLMLYGIFCETRRCSRDYHCGGREYCGKGIYMKIDQNRLRELMSKPARTPSPDELRREENVFFVGGNLPEQETVETLFESYFQSHAALFHLTFGELGNFGNGEILARMIKKNFNAHLVARLDYPVPGHLIERAYAAGVDILDIPLLAADAAQFGSAAGDRLRAIDAARSVFPRWSVVSTLTSGGDEAATVAAIETLLERDVVPLVRLSPGGFTLEAASRIYRHLHHGWCARKVLVKPLLPLIHVTTPLVPAAPKGILRGFIDSIEDRRLLATSDLRRLLRVKEVEESFASSGL